MHTLATDFPQKDNSHMTQRPERTEAVEYYFTYIDQVPAGDLHAYLETQAAETAALLKSISDEDSHRRYAPEKWSVREVMSHVNDAERIFTFRALWFARGFDSPLPSFDQNIAVSAARSEEGAWSRQIEEFSAIRLASRSLFASLPAEAWSRSGTASGNPVTVRALAFIVAGHTAHHVRILREKYL
ncbi:MAG: DinB family protein [bacterium]